MGKQLQISDKAILQPYIKEGKIDYIALKNDNWLDDQLESLNKTDLLDLDRSSQFAFWLNAYNLITLKAVLNELEKNQNWKGVTSFYSKFKFFYLKKHRIANQSISLYNLENKILRKQFKDPRLHFAINCASISCPILPGKLFEGESLDEYLEALTSEFINNQHSVKYKNNELEINPIFKWYRKDFNVAGGVISFINKYLDGEKIPSSAKIKYIDYDWKVNKQ